MMRLPPEFDAGEETGKRLWVTIKGEQVCLTALRLELVKLGLEIVIEEEMLTAAAPVSAEPDRLLAAVAAALDRIAAESGQTAGLVLSETRMVPVALPAASEVIHLGDHFRIMAAGLQEKAADDVILLTASSVFGSGLHPSTRLVVRAMDELDRHGQIFPGRVLDLGTGSGLLAMMAARRGAVTVMGIDICPEAVAVASENVIANGLDGRVRIAAMPLARIAGCFDLILANLTASVQLRLAVDLQARLAPGGELIISGLLGRQQKEIADFWQGRGLRPIAAYAEGSWRALRLQNVCRGG
jgi:ribosomal protein L11 methylase PrmA